MVADPGSCLFIQFAREPLAGAVKTRMIPHLSPQQACSLHAELVLRTACTLVTASLGRVELAVAGDAQHELFERCRAMGVAALYQQRGEDLGERMYNALSDALERFERVVLVGSDCPGIDRAYLVRAVTALDGAGIVLGPAADGGYVLVGAKQVPAEMFKGIMWGSGSVLSETIQCLRRLGLGWVELPVLADIDRPADLPLWEALRDT